MKSDISSIKKRAEHDFVGALVKFHNRQVEKLTIKLRKLEQARKHKRNDMEFTKNVKPVATVLNSSKQSDINKLAVELTTKLTQVDKLVVNLRAQTSNKEVKSYMCVFSAFKKTLTFSPDECASITFFTGKGTNNTLSTLNQHGNHRFNSQWPWKPS